MTVGEFNSDETGFQSNFPGLNLKFAQKNVHGLLAEENIILAQFNFKEKKTFSAESDKITLKTQT